MGFFWVNLKSANKTERILMESGAKFENKSAIYTMNDDGNLSIFDKDKKKETTGNTINVKDYQYQIVKAVANNSNDGKNVEALSIKDIQIALKQDNLKKDLSQFLKGGYEVKNPKTFPDEHKFSAYITNGNENTSAVLAFQYNSDTEDFLGDNLFVNKNIIETKSCEHTVKKGEDLLSIAIKYDIDTYQLIAANTQLKAGVNYEIRYPKDDLAKIITKDLPAETKITIPARYKVKSGTCKNIHDVAKITGVSESYLR